MPKEDLQANKYVYMHIKTSLYMKLVNTYGNKSHKVKEIIPGLGIGTCLLYCKMPNRFLKILA